MGRLLEAWWALFLLGLRRLHVPSMNWNDQSLRASSFCSIGINLAKKPQACYSRGVFCALICIRACSLAANTGCHFFWRTPLKHANFVNLRFFWCLWVLK